MTAIHNQTHEIEMVDPGNIPFPFKTAYPGQVDIIRKLNGFEQAGLSSPTGTGKTAVITSVTRGQASIIIEPRKFLQKQVQSYYNDFVLFGRSEYKCFHAPSAATAPCNRKETCNKVHKPKECTIGQPDCDTDSCKVFMKGAEVHKFPCENCEYLNAQITAKQVLKRGGTVICNFGNFWSLLKYAKVVVVDEADLFFREISKPTKMFYSSTDDEDDSIETILQREKKGLEEAVKKTPSQEAYRLQNLLYTVNFLLENKDLCFKYQRKGKRGGGKIYIEISPDSTNVLKDKIFKNKKLLIVSATLGDFNIPSHSYSVWQRRGVFYCPVGKLTSTNLKVNPWVLNLVAENIETISTIAEGMFDTHKFPVHCGNLGTHAAGLNNLLGPDRRHVYCSTCGEHVTDISPEEQEIRCPKCNKKWTVLEEKCTLHKSGKLMETIDNFRTNNSRYLLIAGADYGADFPDFKLQFIAKHPYMARDERIRVLERVMGREKFNAYYRGDARARLVQQCGRVCRGAGDVGFTVIFDSKFMEEFMSDKKNYPQWFKDGFDGRYY